MSWCFDMMGYLCITIIMNNSRNVCSRLRSDKMVSCLIHINSREIFTIMKDTEGQNYQLQLIFISQTKLGNRHSWDSKGNYSLSICQCQLAICILYGIRQVRKDPRFMVLSRGFFGIIARQHMLWSRAYWVKMYSAMQDVAFESLYKRHCTGISAGCK